MFSCVNVSSKEDAAHNDTVSIAKRVNAIKMSKNDSLAQAQIAYGTLIFGTTSEENRKLYEEDFHSFIHNNYTFEAYYNADKKLYMLSIEGLNRMPDYQDSLVKNQWQNLVDTITKRFGQPDSTYPYPDFPISKQEKIQWTNIWTLATRKIKIGISKSSGRYYAVCQIYDEPMFNKVQEENAAGRGKKENK